jgi:hypothetical protein
MQPEYVIMDINGTPNQKQNKKKAVSSNVSKNKFLSKLLRLVSSFHAGSRALAIQGTKKRGNTPLRTGLLLLLLEERKKSNTRNLHNLETNTRNITLCVTATTESSNENLVVLIDEVKATIVRNECGNLLAVLDELHTHALTHGGVGLLRLNTAAETPASKVRD